MAYETTKSLIETFNRTYQVNVSFARLQSEARRVGHNEAFKSEFLKAYKQVALKELLASEDSVAKSHLMFKDFNKLVTNTYIKDTPIDLRANSCVSKNMGIKTNQEAYDMLIEAQNELPKNQIDAVAQNYLKGNISMDDMVQASRSASIQSGKRGQTEIAAYAAALKTVNNSRSFLWKLFHFFQNFAERRNILTIANMLSPAPKDLNDPVFTRAGSELVNSFQRDKDTVNHVLKNQNLLYQDINYAEFEQQIKDDFEKNFEYSNETERNIAFRQYRQDRYKDLSDQDRQKDQQEFNDFLKEYNSDNSNGGIIGEDNNANIGGNYIIIADDKPDKSQFTVDDLKEDIYNNSDSMPLSDDEEQKSTYHDLIS